MLSEIFFHDTTIQVMVPVWFWFALGGLVIAALAVALSIVIFASRGRDEHRN